MQKLISKEVRGLAKEKEELELMLRETKYHLGIQTQKLQTSESRRSRFEEEMLLLQEDLRNERHAHSDITEGYRRLDATFGQRMNDWEHEKNIQLNRSRDLEKRNAELTQERDDLQVRIRAMEVSCEEEMHRMETAHNKALQYIEDKYTQRLSSTEEAHARKIGELNASHAREIAKIEELHTLDLTDSDDQHKKEMERRKNEVQLLEDERKDLRAALISNPNRFQSLPDSVIKYKLNELIKDVKDTVRALTQNNRETDIGFSRVGPEQLMAFLDRSPRIMHLRGFLESQFWNMLIKKFFSPPFGFAAMGSYGLKLEALYCELFATPPHAEYSYPGPDNVTERWRSMTIEVVRQSLSQDSGKHKAGSEVLQSHERQHLDACRTIIQSFQQMSFDLDSDGVSRIVDKASALAFDLGAQQSRLALILPKPGDMVSSTTSFYVNKSGGRIAAEDVIELAVSPGLRKMGPPQQDLLPTSVYLRTV
ncbi:hypothetical protein M501DRAFT_1017598 [Patellaria atrata CBS 101060]|uniref:Uncharacterized protein n=1 Tax=Patellaria atrata CBS 101060 TaxID=1346257 RepID=A0A9P4SA33_9PEZI|nr:hypothetical protein M501DRAFT_1017598 [Patellaria atrata CBS 101060]